MIFFDELLQAQDFRGAVDEIGRDFRARFALPAIHQLGLVVEDVEKSADELESKGLGPFFIVNGSVDVWQELGDEKGFSGKMGLACYKGYEIELLEPGEGSDFYRQCVDAGGRPVVQHLGFLVNDVDIWASILSQAGWPVWVKGDMGVWPVRTRFAYMDTVKDSGIIMEFINWRVLGVTFQPPMLLYRGLAGLEKRLGIRSISL
ncbi:MAG TPA: hypothetical protein ENN05_07055 [Deltaproteobacteria bacterium]|nr:hypothetical protein [Deltaproteobacteria bacterium]